MIIRRAEEADCDRLLELLAEVLELHAKLRPDIFIPNTTKYSRQELLEKMKDEDKPIYVAVEEDKVVGYAFCVVKEQPFSNNMIPFQSFFIDDLCVDETVRGKSIGKALFDFVKEEAARRGCYAVTLNVWEGNDGAKRFYEKMGMHPKETEMEIIL